MTEFTEGLYTKLNELFNNHQAALLCTQYFDIAQILDDLVDKDKEVNNYLLVKCFRTMLYDIPTNPFYLQYKELLLPILDITISKWEVANKYEASKEQLHKAYMLRASIYDIFTMCYKIIYGPLIDCSPIYDLYGEIFKTYKKEILCPIQSQQ